MLRTVRWLPCAFLLLAGCFLPDDDHDDDAYYRRARPEGDAAARAAADLPAGHRHVVRDREPTAERPRPPRPERPERDRRRPERDRTPDVYVLPVPGEGPRRPPAPPDEAAPAVEAAAEDREAKLDLLRHPWFEAGGEGWGGRVGLAVPIYDEPDIGVGVGYELDLRRQVWGPVGAGFVLGQSFASNEATGALARGHFDTLLLLADVTVDVRPFPSRPYLPVVSLGAGAGALFVDPDPSETLKEDLGALGLRLEEESFVLPDLRLRADLLIPLDRGSFLSLGVARDAAWGDVESKLRDLWTDAVLSVDRQRMHFDSTSVQIAIVVRF